MKKQKNKSIILNGIGRTYQEVEVNQNQQNNNNKKTESKKKKRFKSGYVANPTGVASPAAHLVIVISPTSCIY